MASLSGENYNPEEPLLATLNDLDIGFVKVSNDGTILNHNLTFNKIFGYQPEKNLVSTKIFDYWLNSEEGKSFREDLYKKGIVKKYVAPAKKIDGEKFFLQLNFKINKNSNGEIISSEGTFIDVTERIENEQKLKDSEEKYRLISENANDMISILNEKFEIEYFNENAYQKLLGYSKDEVIGNLSLNYIHPDDIEHAARLFKEILKSGEVQGDVRIKNKFGTYFWFEAKGKTFIDKNGKKKILMISRDITERKESEQKLKESEEKYRLITENANDLIAVLDDKLQYKYVNKGYELLGYSKEEIYNSQATDLLHHDDIKRAVKAFRKGLTTGTGLEELRVKHKDGRFSWFEVKGKTYRDLNGKTNALLISRDITERKNVEEDLKSRYEYERLISLISIDFINVLNENLNDLINHALKKISQFVNAVRCSLFIYSEDLTRVTNTNEWCIDPNDSQIALLQNIPSEKFGYYLKLLKEKKDVIINQFDDIPSEANGEREWVKKYGFRSLLFVPMLFKNKLFGTLGFYGEVNIEREWSKDIVNLLHVLANIFVNSIKSKQSEEILYHERDLIRTLLENHPDFIYFKDKKARFQHISKRFCEFFGRSMEDIIGKSDLELFPEEIAKQTHNEDLQVIKTGIALINKEESAAGTWVLTTKIPWFDKDGNIKGLFGISHDITELKKTQEKLKELDIIKSEFLRRASHELKTPLISIKGFSDLILTLYREELNPDIISKLGEINQGCERLQNIINDLIHTSRLESSELKPKFEREDLTFLINYCVDELHSIAAEREHSINIELPNSLIARFEKEEIHDVITNLLTNAIKYTPPKGWIDIKTETIEDFIVVSIKDNGIGFTEEEKDRIFQQFGKIERYGQDLDLGIDGSGLGLYISKKIVESHGGKIWMESEGKHKGSTFYFSLPK